MLLRGVECNGQLQVQIRYKNSSLPENVLDLDNIVRYEDVFDTIPGPSTKSLLWDVDSDALLLLILLPTTTYTVSCNDPFCSPADHLCYR